MQVIRKDDGFNMRNVKWTFYLVGNKFNTSGYVEGELDNNKAMGKNIQYDLQVEANSSGILIDARQLREYFEIEYNENLGDILQEFIERLGTFIPTSIPNNVSEIEKMQ